MGKVKSGLWWEGGRGVILVEMGKDVLELVEDQQQQVSCATVCHPRPIPLKRMSCWHSPLSYTALTVSYLF